MEGETGRDKMNSPARRPKSQVRIEFKDLDPNKAAVEKILLAALDKFNLYDNSYESRVPHTIRSIVEGKGKGFGLGGRVVENHIYVDFMRHRSESPKFDEAHDFILNELKNAFHVELEEIWEDNPAYRKTSWQ
jgi:hypothetical protein